MSKQNMKPPCKSGNSNASSSYGSDSPMPSTTKCQVSTNNGNMDWEVSISNSYQANIEALPLKVKKPQSIIEKSKQNSDNPKSQKAKWCHKKYIYDKTKKLLNEMPGSFILGKIPFMACNGVPQSYCNARYTSNLPVHMKVLGDPGNVSYGVDIAGRGPSSDCYPVKPVNDLPEVALEELLTNNYSWILEDYNDLKKGFLNIKVAVLEEKAPYVKAKSVVQYLTQKTFPDYVEKVEKNLDSIETFLKEIKLAQKRDVSAAGVNVKNEKLKTNLCSYQARAVEWMMRRESPNLQEQNQDWISSLMERIDTPTGNPAYYNVYSQNIYTTKLECPPFPRGGILADEMGLGKTVAVIALILNNPLSKSNETDTDEFLIPLEEQNVSVKKVCPIKLMKESGLAFPKIPANLENHLSPREELALATAKRGSSMKRALNKWYESTLAEYSATTPSKVPRTSNTLIKCLCGDPSAKRKGDCVECGECKKLQHAKCVGFQEKHRYFCPNCWTKQKLVKSEATLIITPPNIYYQWFDEINRHVEKDTFPNGILMYDDVKCKFVQPFVLASYDVVICTYTRLRAEINHATRSESSRKLRNEERFLKQCSPLTQVNWWRLCLDEAQMVEAESSAISQMARMIPAVNRWSVTGTPLQKSINDLYYLLDFLRVEPYNDKSSWNSLLYVPYINGNKKPLCTTMSDIFWRNCKEDVSDEMLIPEQTVRHHILKFTAVEQNFYMREHTTSADEFVEGLKRNELDMSTTLDSLDRTTLTKIIKPLLNLRQACSHPLAVKGNKISTKTGSMTVTDLYKYLHNKTKIECEEELRKYISSLNGRAGLSCIREDWANAVENYRKALEVCEEYKDKLNVDSLQKIHSLTNMADALQHYESGLSDDILRAEAKELENKYIDKVLKESNGNQKLLSELSQKVMNMARNLSERRKIWYVHFISFLTLQDAIEEVTEKVSAELLANQIENKKNVDIFLSKISSPKAVEVVVKNWLDNVNENRLKVLDRLETLKEKPKDTLVYGAVHCHLRNNQDLILPKKCEICSCEDVMLDYECSLFAVTRKTLKEEYEKVMDGAQTRGSWKAHKTERLLQVILNVAKNKPNVAEWAVTDGKNHMSMLEAMKKEFKQIRVVWMDVNHLVQAQDELSMCKLRLRVRLPGEPNPSKPTTLTFRQQNRCETIHIIGPHEVDSQAFKLSVEMNLAKSDLRKKYGTLLYLDNVGKKENAKPEPCPVCKTSLNNEWCVLQCGHCYCIDCVRTLLSRNVKPIVNCPVCREVTGSKGLSFIDLSGREKETDIKVAGEHSTKVEAVVRTIIELKRQEENVKVLVFSNWSVVLKIIAMALEENGITYRRLPCYNYQSSIKEFKDPKLNITALLLPVTWGSKGLNLTEATHVFLVDPIMNPAEELQAIGRVHRIGQERETVVHRFIIKGTVEEKIQSSVTEAKDKWNKNKVTLEDLKNLFDIEKNLGKCRNYLPAKDCDGDDD